MDTYEIFYQQGGGRTQQKQAKREVLGKINI